MRASSPVQAMKVTAVLLIAKMLYLKKGEFGILNSEYCHSLNNTGKLCNYVLCIIIEDPFL